MAQNIVMNAATVGGTINTAFSGPKVVPASGLITVDSRDAPSLLALGCAYVNNRVGYTYMAAPVLATAGRLVASTSLANGTLSIANQPDVSRRGALLVAPGTTAITAGNVAIRYVGNDGVDTTDNLSVIAPATATLTQFTSKGISSLTSVIITALAGGTSPGVQLNDTNALACFVDPGFQNFNVFRDTTDSVNATLGTSATSAACYTPTTTLNGTHSFGLGYAYTAPSS